MTQSEKEVEEAIEGINRAVDDGGGCAEAWESLSVQRATDRRGFLKAGTAVAGLLASLGTLPSTVSAANDAVGAEDVDIETNGLETEVERLDGIERLRALAAAFSATEFNRLLVDMVRRYRYLPVINESKAFRSSFKGEQYRTVKLSFETGASNKSASIFWTDNDSLGPVGQKTTYEKVGSEIEVTHTVHYFSNGDVKTTSETESYPFSRNGGGNGFETQVFGGPCPLDEIIVWDCAYQIIYVYAEEIAACATCVASAATTGANPLTYTACAACFGLFLKEYARSGGVCQLCKEIPLFNF